MGRLLDGITQNIRAVELASSGLEATSKLIDQVEEIAVRRRADIEGEGIPGVIDGESYLSRLITDAGADFYFKLDDESGSLTDYGDVGTTGTYSASVGRQDEILFEGSEGSAYFNGVDSFINTAYDPLFAYHRNDIDMAYTRT